MEKQKYEQLIKKHAPNENKTYYAVMAFIIGGFIGLLGEVLVRFYTCTLEISRNEASTYMIVTLIFIASLLTALGVFDKLVTKAKCGLLIPITGFAHSMTSSAIDYKKEGPVYGVGSNLFKLAGTVILYGIVSSWFFGMVRYIWEVLK